MSTQAAKARAQSKVKRQKQFIAVGSVVLLAILGFEMTKLLSHGNSHSAAPVIPATTPSTLPPPSSSSGWNLPDTDRVVVRRSADQLVSFGLFSSKDPFVQQLALAPSPATPVAPSPAATTRTALKPAKPLGVGLKPVTSTTPQSSTPPGPVTATPEPQTAPAPPASTITPTPTTLPADPTAPEAVATTVLMSTNGNCEKVAVNGTFPAGADIFRLVSIAHGGKSVEITVAGGSFDSGQATVTLKLGQRLTLVNTGDGTRYVIELKSKCAVVRPASSPGESAAPMTATPAPVVPPPPTTTTTTPPIVPDALDTTTTPTG